MSALLATLLLCLPVAAQDPAKELKSKDPEERARVVLRIANGDDPKREQYLGKALEDDDWAIAETAGDALAERGGEKAIDDLVDLALGAAPARLRLAASLALARDPAAASRALAKKLNGPAGARACEALVPILRAGRGTVEPKTFLKHAERGKDADLRAAAARCAVLAQADDRAALLGKLFDVDGALVPCSALDEVRRGPRAADRAPLLGLLARADLFDVVERRAEAAAAAVLALETERAGAFAHLAPLLAGKSPRVAARAVRVAEALVGAGLPSADALTALAPALSQADAGVRAAAVHALRRLGEAGAARARSAAEGDASARVRSTALRAFAAVAPVHDGEGLALVLGRLAKDADPLVRQDAAVLLARKGLVEAVEPLAAALHDPDWGVAVCAAISLGRTRNERAVAPLAGLLANSKEWQRRAAAVVGLARTYQRQAFPHLIDALADADPCVQKSAHAFLRATAREDLPPDAAAWRAWWAQSGEGLRLVDPETKTELEKRFGRSGTVAPEVFRDLDLVVLSSRGDHVEVALRRQEIPHRLVGAGKVGAAGLTPDGVFVSNCTGEIEADDVTRLRWFVLAGGSLFGSCWALSETIERAVPGVLAKKTTSGEVLGQVEAETCAADNPLLEGVFPPRTAPLYMLQGAHLIEVLDPERAEVLIDSPVCAERFGAGTLAAWFPLGHGSVLDSANHFDAQGLELAEGLKTRIDRQAFAVDHMAYPLESLRATRGEPWWDNSLKASQHVQDLSVLRIVTNLVRLRRAALGD